MGNTGLKLIKLKKSRSYHSVVIIGFTATADDMSGDYAYNS